jgi:hypothetical protein
MKHNEGQRMNSNTIDSVRSCRNWQETAVSPKVPAGKPELPCWHPGFREERIGSSGNRHLNDLAESTSMNVRGSPETDFPAVGKRNLESVGAIIVV